ncbi:UNVERIFIED_CONTAM: E3 ubiquitin-protein ligase SDIR1 [Sesamum indicum]
MKDEKLFALLDALCALEWKWIRLVPGVFVEDKFVPLVLLQFLETMSFVFRGTRGDMETGFPGLIPERRAVRVHARPVNTNSLAFLVTVLLLFMILNSHQMSPNFLLWLVLGVFLMATTLRMYATCQQLQAQAQAHAVAASGLLGHTELRLHMPPSIALATRGRLQGLRLQLALLDREFDDLDYETLRALDADNVPTASMSEEEINALPVHKYKVSSPQRLGICAAIFFSYHVMVYLHEYLTAEAWLGTKLQVLGYVYFSLKRMHASFSNVGSSTQQGSSSSSVEKKQDPAAPQAGMKTTDDDLTCSVCLEQVNAGELIRSLPCLHQFHVNCIDPWLRQQGTCPVCKFRAGSRWSEIAQGEIDASDMV